MVAPRALLQSEQPLLGLLPFGVSRWTPLSFGPCLEPGSAELHQSGAIRGLTFTYAVDASQATEDMLLFKASGSPAEVPMDFLEPESPRVATGVQPYGGTAFTSRTDFQTNAWSRLSPPSGRTTYYMRVKARRGTVSDHSALADALAETTPSRWVEHLVLRDGNGDVLNEGWVYVQFGQTVSGVLHRLVHQFLPSDMDFPSGDGTVSMEPVTDSPPSLEELCDNTVADGMLYAVSAVEATVVTSSNDLTGSPPASPPWPSSGATENS